MEKADYIIVGGGFAGMFLAHRLLLGGENFKIFVHGKSASEVSAGIANPVVLKKFTTFWLAQQQLDFFKETIREIEAYTGAKLLVDEPVRRIFHDDRERGLWQKKSSEPDLAGFLARDFKYFEGISNPFGTGEVLQSVRLDVPEFFSAIKACLKEKGLLIEEEFDYGKLDPKAKNYADRFKFNKIIFAEGIGVYRNPFFKNIPVEANKGHRLLVNLNPNFRLAETFKKKHFLFPYSENLHYYGGTYARGIAGHSIDEDAVAQLRGGLAEILADDFQIENVDFGIRPTVRDRRPILGESAEFPGIFVFNGLGARGILNGCWFSEVMYHFVAHGKALPREEVSLERFNSV